MLRLALAALLFAGLTQEIPGEPVLFSGLWRSPLSLLGPLFLPISPLSMSAWQLLLVLLAPICLLSRGAFRRRPWSMDAAIALSIGTIALTFAWGLARGGSAYQAYYQLWRFLAGLLLALMLLSVFRRPRDLRLLGVVVLAAAVTRAVLTIYFYWAYARFIRPSLPHLTNHDDSLTFVAGLALLAAWVTSSRSRWRWAISALAVPVILYAMVLNHRRIAWMELVYVLAVQYLLLSAAARRSVNRWGLVAAPALAVYVAVGWGRPEPMFAPVRAFSTTTNQSSDNSTLARHEENRNLLYTLSTAGNPVLGTGWGHPYLKVSSVYANFDRAWWQYLYMPHNSFLNSIVSGGFVGLFGMWIIVPVAAFLGARGARHAAGPVERAAAMTAVAVLPAYQMQCFGDLGLQAFTCNLLMGTALAVAARTSALATSRRPARTGAVADQAPVQPPALAGRRASPARVRRTTPPRARVA